MVRRVIEAVDERHALCGLCHFSPQLPFQKSEAEAASAAYDMKLVVSPPIRLMLQFLRSPISASRSFVVFFPLMCNHVLSV